MVLLAAKTVHYAEIEGIGITLMGTGDGTAIIMFSQYPDQHVA